MRQAFSLEEVITADTWQNIGNEVQHIEGGSLLNFEVENVNDGVGGRDAFTDFRVLLRDNSLAAQYPYVDGDGLAAADALAAGAGPVEAICTFAYATAGAIKTLAVGEKAYNHLNIGAPSCIQFQVKGTAAKTASVRVKGMVGNR